MKNFLFLTVLFSLLGIMDAGYLTWEHYSGYIPPCSTSIWVDCGKVLQSSYSMMMGVPLALLGVLFYTSMLGMALYRLSHQDVQEKIFRIIPIPHFLDARWQRAEQFALDIHFLMALTGILFSAYFVFLQLFVIQSICLYCMFSAINSTILFGLLAWQRLKLQ